MFLAALVPLCLIVAPTHLRAQSAFDSACYYPVIGDPSEIDTIYGAVNNQMLGGLIKNLGTKPNGGFGNMLIANLDHADHSDSGSLFQVQTGPPFNLHNLNGLPQKLGLNNIFPIDGSGAGFRLGHFHDQSHVDIFVVDLWRIYWADDNGNYDSTRYTDLSLNVQGDHPFGGYSRNYITPYITHLTSDTMDDLVLGFFTTWIDNTKDTMFEALFRGGTNLMSKTLAYEDTSAMAYPILQVSNGQNYLVSTQGDFRGTGRDDLIVADQSSNLWFYKNDPPFSIGALAKAVANDTLLVQWQNPDWIQHVTVNSAETPYFSMRAMPKAPGDKSVDFMPVFTTQANPNGAIYIFRGGPDFGSKRLIIDSADFVITEPDLGYDLWPVNSLVDAGDMTGTGNHVLLVDGASGQTGYDNFYVTGAALDNKIDMYSYAYGGYDDTLTADDDSLEDFMEGGPYYTSPEDLSNGKSLVGTIWIYKGSKQIPVHLNPQFAEVKSVPQQNGAGITFAPNPTTHSWSVATIIWPVSEEADLCVYDLLGTAVQSGNIRLLGGPEQQRIYFPNLAAGVYVVEIHGASGVARAKLVIVH